MKNTKLWRLLREPLFHFIAIGGLFFLLYSLVNDTSRISTDTIVITPARIKQISTGFDLVWKRMPNDDELDVLIEEDIREEVYYRDALALGLDKNDAMVRRRMLRKMEFLTDTGAYLKEPSAGELEVFFNLNEQSYRREPRLAFEQIYVGIAPTEESITELLKILLVDPAQEISSLGEPTRLPAQLRLTRPDGIDSVFGKGFFKQIAELSPGVWGGPVVSSYGLHLVRSLDGQSALTPPLEEVREAVIKDWKAEKALQNRALDYAQRRARFVVEIQRSDPQVAQQ